MIKVGILGAAGYTGGELIRVLLNHPQAEIVFANSESNAGNLVSDVHEGLIGETDLKFTDEMPFDKVDVVFFCFGHGKSEAFLKEHTIPASVKIIDLAQDFRIKGDHDYVYGLPEINKVDIAKAQHLANPGCFATAIQFPASAYRRDPSESEAGAGLFGCRHRLHSLSWRLCPWHLLYSRGKDRSTCRRDYQHL